MKTVASIKNHPLHAMLVAFPIAFYTLTPIAFATYQWFSADTFWYRLGYFSCYAGLGTAVLASVPGFIDWNYGIERGTAAKARGLLHMGLNVSAMILFIVASILLWGTWNLPAESVVAHFGLTAVGALITTLAGVHGWEMVATHKMGVNMTPEQRRLEPDVMTPEEHRRSLSPRPV